LRPGTGCTSFGLACCEVPGEQPLMAAFMPICLSEFAGTADAHHLANESDSRRKHVVAGFLAHSSFRVKILFLNSA
jgi:hypothetical protein